MLKYENRLLWLINSIYNRVFTVKHYDVDSDIRRNLKRYVTNNKQFKNQIQKFNEDLIKESIKVAKAYVKRFKAAKDVDLPEFMPLTEEVVRITEELGDSIRAAIIAMLADEAIYYESIPKLNKRVKEVWDTQKYRVNRFVRTYVNTVANYSHIYYYRESGVVEYVQFSAHLDERTSFICRSLNGTIFRLDSSNMWQYKPPLHFHCRSRLVPYFGKVHKKLLLEPDGERNLAEWTDKHFKITKKVNEDDLLKAIDNMNKFKLVWDIPKVILEKSLIIEKSKFSVIIEKGFDEAVIKKHINDIWEQTEKTGKEHAFGIIEGEDIIKVSGDENSVNTWDIYEKANGRKYLLYHTHPGDYDLTLSSSDIANFLYRKNQMICAAVTKNKIYIIKKRDDTITLSKRSRIKDLIKEARGIAEEKFEKKIDKYIKAKRWKEYTIPNDIPDEDWNKMWNEALEETVKYYANLFGFDYEVKMR